MTKEAGVYSARGIGELNNTVHNLAQQGFRIISVFETSEEFYHVVAQMETEVVYEITGSSMTLGGLDPVTRDFIKADFKIHENRENLPKIGTGAGYIPEF